MLCMHTFSIMRPCCSFVSWMPTDLLMSAIILCTFLFVVPSRAARMCFGTPAVPAAPHTRVNEPDTHWQTTSMSVICWS